MCGDKVGTGGDEAGTGDDGAGTAHKTHVFWSPRRTSRLGGLQLWGQVLRLQTLWAWPSFAVWVYLVSF